MTKDLTFQAIKLLSQRIVSNPETIPEGIILQKTSCMNPEDAELVGLIEIMIERNNTPERKKHLEELSHRFQIIGLSKWMKGELTQLGFRAGLRYQKQSDVGVESKEEQEQTLDEADIVAPTE